MICIIIENSLKASSSANIVKATFTPRVSNRLELHVVTITDLVSSTSYACQGRGQGVPPDHPPDPATYHVTIVSC